MSLFAVSRVSKVDNSTKKKKKKLYRFPVSVICHINKTHNNLFLTLTKLDGTVLLQLSGGKIGKKGPKRDTPNTAELLGRRFGELFHSMGYKRCITKINGSFDGNIFFRFNRSSDSHALPDHQGTLGIFNFFFLAL